MIKVSFWSHSADDICELLESNLTSRMDIEDWLVQKIPSICFDCMDYPQDLESFYDCFFTSSSEDSDAKSIYRLLKEETEEIAEIYFSVSIVDNKLNFIKEINV
ncbi:MAG: hypothetical protein K2J77_05825 [Oscillospiraceae bacterium]|nr:hypothetical protein [Oscillospiraceae bacterium]